MRQLARIALATMLVCIGVFPYGCSKYAEQRDRAARIAASDAADASATVAAAGTPSIEGSVARRGTARRAAVKPAKLTHVDPRILACETAIDGKALMACLDGLMIAAPPDGAWLDAGAHKLGATIPTVIPGSWAIPAWFINASTGLDTNTCVTSGAPCKTLGQIYARWGTTDPFITSVMITLQTALPNTDVLRTHPTNLTGGTGLTVQGVVTTIGSGSLSGLVAKNLAAGQELQANLGASAATYVGQRICNTTHPSCAKVSKIISGNIARISQPVLSSDNTTEVDTWANGDSFAVSSMPAVYVDNIAGITLNNVTVFTTEFGSVFASFCLLEDSALGAATVFYGDNATTVLNSTDEAAFSGGGGFELHNNCQLLNGVAHFPVMQGAGWQLGGDVEITLEIELYDNSGISELGPAFLEAGTYVHTVGLVSTNGAIYGNGWQLNVDFGTLVYGTTALSFLGTGNIISVNNTGNATTCDYAHFPEQCISGLPLSIANLDTPYPAGFGGYARGDNTATAFRKFNIPPVTPTPYVTPIANGGQPNTSGCPSGQYVGGAALTCSTPPGSGVSCPINAGTCLTGQTPVANGGTGINTCGAGLVVEGTGGATLQCISPPWITATASVPVGGTGVTSGPAHSVATFEATSPMGSVGPCTAGLPFLAAGASADPTCNTPLTLSGPGVAGITQVPNGGTGVNAFTPNAVLVGATVGTNPIVGVGPATLGLVLQANGGAAPPFFGLVSLTPGAFPSVTGTLDVPHGGTGLTTCGNEQLVEGTAGGPLQCAIITGTDILQNPTVPGNLVVTGIRGNNVPNPAGSGSGTALMWNVAGSGVFSWTVPQAPLFNATQGNAMPLNTFVTLATITDTAAAAGSTYTVDASVSCPDPNTSAITYGLSLNSTTTLFWGHTAAGFGTLTGGVAGVANGSLNYSAVFTGTSTIRLMAKNTVGGTSHCDGDLKIVRSP